MTATVPETEQRASETETWTLTIPEAATHLRVSRSRLYTLVNTGQLEAIDIADPGARTTKLRITSTSLKAYLDGRPRVTFVA